MSYVIKKIPEDFIVKELTDFPLKGKGKYTCFWLTKKDYTTSKALMAIAKALGIHVKKISYAGLKDRQAITTQLCTVEGNQSKKIENLKARDITVSVAGYSDRPISLGLLKANHFEITVRNIDTIPDFSDLSFYNFFGEQRFSKDNVAIAILLLEKQFDKAVMVMMEDNPELAASLQKHGALNTINGMNKKILKIYISSFQSWAFNETLKNFLLANAEPPETLPLVGFGTEDIPPFMKSLLDQVNVGTRDFIFKKIHGLSSEGSTRSTKTMAFNFSCGPLEDDELHKGKKKVLLKFDLKSGCYATEFIRKEFQQE